MPRWSKDKTDLNIAALRGVERFVLQDHGEDNWIIVWNPKYDHFSVVVPTPNGKKYFQIKVTEQNR